MSKLILLRHGQSTWNKENKFTGWVDVDLSPKGIEEAKQAGEKLQSYQVDCLFTSVLKRAIETADLALAVMEQKPAQRFSSEALNERHYGDLQGLNKDETRAKHGAEQVHVWRRSFDVQPPGGESLKDTCERVLPYFKEQIRPQLDGDKTVLVVAHGNSLRGLVKELDKLGEQEITTVEIPTGVPIVYELDSNYQIVNKITLST